MIDKEGKGWLQEGLYALRHDKAHNTSRPHTIDNRCEGIQYCTISLLVNREVQMKE